MRSLKPIAVFHPRRAVRGFLHDRSGVTAIEFALIAPAFFSFLFATLEIGLIVWFQGLLNDGAIEAAGYLRNETMNCTRQGTSTNNCTAATMAGVRQAICNVIQPGGMSCDAGSLKVAVVSADNLVANPPAPTAMIDNAAFNLTTSRAYIIAVGYEWPFGLPTSRLLLPNVGARVQAQARVYATTAEKALR